MGGTPQLSNDALREAWEATKRAGSLSGAARELDIARQTLQDRVAVAVKRLGLPDPLSSIAAFEAPKLPSKERSIDDLIAHRIAESERAVAYEDAANLIEIKIKTPGPVGLMAFGDPHIDDPGCEFRLLKSHVDLAAARRGYVFAGNIGDVRNNWIGRLGRLYSQTTVSAKEGWKLTEWMMSGAGVHWAWLVRGNHDCWSGDNDPLDWISRESGVGVDRDAGVRIAFKHPNGAVTRMHARHDFQGNSIFNPLHALKRETLHGHRDHVIIAGHRHIGADARDVNGDGNVFAMVRVSGYKVSDSYRHTLGLQAKPLHPAAMIIVDPEEPDTSPNRVWVAPSVEVGCRYLDFLRANYRPKPKRAA